MTETLANQAEKISPPRDNRPANKLLHGPLLSALTRLAFPTIAVLFILMRAMAAGPFTPAANLTLATANDHPGAPPVGAVQLNGNARSELAASSLDNAREGDGTLYGYRV